MQSTRWPGIGHPATFIGEYRAMGESAAPAPGSLEWFLTERYRVYSVTSAGAVLALDVQHPPWRIAPAEVRFGEQTMLAAAGVPCNSPPDLAHFSARQDVLLWPPRRVQ
jgi:uncharacterized protein YqjF (DUF2071 family)